MLVLTGVGRGGKDLGGSDGVHGEEFPGLKGYGEGVAALDELGGWGEGVGVGWIWHC